TPIILLSLISPHPPSATLFPYTTLFRSLGPTLQQKIAYMTQTRAAYKAVVGIGSAIWSVAALGRLSSVDAVAATALRSLNLPERSESTRRTPVTSASRMPSSA